MAKYDWEVESKKSLTERDDSIKGSDVKRWMISGGDIQITFKNGNELVGIIVEYREDETDSKAECYLCEDLTDDYTGHYFIVEVYNGKIISIKFQSFNYLIDYMDKNDYELVESKKEEKKSLKESFEYEGTIPLEELTDILDDEWKYSNNGGVFSNSSHWDDEARDEDRYIEISAIVDFNSASNWGFANKHVQKLYDDECNKIYKEVNEDYDAYDEIVNEYDPILFVLTIDLKELLVYADVDLGNGLGSTEVAREKLADNEKDFRKQIQRMIDAF